MSAVPETAETSLFTYGVREWSERPQTAFDSFLADLRFDGRALRPTSFAIYRGMFERVMNWTQERQKTIFELDADALELFLEAKGLSAETKHRYLLVFKTLFTHLALVKSAETHGAIAYADNPARTLLLQGRAPDREEPEWLNPTELAAFIAALPAETTWKKARTNAMVWAILGAGLRSSEVLALTVSDLNFKAGSLESIWVQARRPRPSRQVPIHFSARAHLEAWYRQRNSTDFSGNLLFPTTMAGGALKPVTLFRLIQSTLDAANIVKRYEGATLLRNTCGAQWLAQHDSLKVMQWMGHSTLRTTELLMPKERRSPRAE